MSKLLRLKDTHYWQARHFAFYLCKLTGTYMDCRDILHDAYLSWYGVHKTNLFEQEKPVIFNKIRSVLANKYRSGKFMSNGVIYPRIRCVLESDHDSDLEYYHYVPYVTPTIEEDLTYATLEANLKIVLTSKEWEIVRQLEEGETKKAIARQQETYPELLNYSIKRIRKKVQQVL